MTRGQKWHLWHVGNSKGRELTVSLFVSHLASSLSATRMSDKKPGMALSLEKDIVCVGDGRKVSNGESVLVSTPSTNSLIIGIDSLPLTAASDIDMKAGGGENCTDCWNFFVCPVLGGVLGGCWKLEILR